MIRRAFLKRMALAVLGSGMLADALTSRTTLIPDPMSAHYLTDSNAWYVNDPTYSLGFRISKQAIEDDLYGSWRGVIGTND